MRQQKKRKKHRFWVREIFQERQELGAYHRLIMGRVVSFPVVEIGFILSQRHYRFLFISVVAGLLILLQRQVTTDNDLMETGLKGYSRGSNFSGIQGTLTWHRLLCSFEYLFVVK